MLHSSHPAGLTFISLPRARAHAFHCVKAPPRPLACLWLVNVSVIYCWTPSPILLLLLLYPSYSGIGERHFWRSLPRFSLPRKWLGKLESCPEPPRCSARDFAGCEGGVVPRTCKCERLCHCDTMRTALASQVMDNGQWRYVLKEFVLIIGKKL